MKLNKKTSLVAVAVFLMAIQPLLILPTAQAATVHTDVTPSTAYNMITSGQYPRLTILDVRNQSEYNNGAIANSILIPLWQLPQRMGELSQFKNSEILVYCATGARGNNASLLLDANNFTKVYDITGGLNNWNSSKYPIIVPQAGSSVSTINAWTTQTAIAHWDVIDVAHGNVTIGIDATYTHNPAEAADRVDRIDVKVTHVPQGVSSITGYNVNIISGPTWTMDRVYLNATLAFNWTTGGLMNHPIAIEWRTSPQAVTLNKYSTNQTTVTANGAWRSGIGNLANATMIIGGAGPHPSIYNSTWAAVGVSTPQTMSAPTVTAFNDVTIMAGQSWYFFAHGTNGAGTLNYQWYEGTTMLTGQTSQLLQATKSTAGTYTYTCAVTDALSNKATSNTITLTVR
jgi:rhodanese-related sulfurtransferase